MKNMLFPISVIVATRSRPVPWRDTLVRLAMQSVQPSELIVVDASDDNATRLVCEVPMAGLAGKLIYLRATVSGAAAQRNEGVARASQPFILFLDDDVRLEPECLARLWAAISADPHLGGVNAMITNQRYQPPGRASRLLYRLLDVRRNGSTYAGRVLGPGMNLLPDDREDLPEVVPVEWLNTTCTLYRREALPEPSFSEHFTGYSLMEDLALSLNVAQRGWKLANARTARLFHDSQPGEHKNSPAEISRMELVNRHYLMTQVLGQRRWPDFFKLGALELFLTAAQVGGRASHFWPVVWGKAIAIRQILSARKTVPTR